MPLVSAHLSHSLQELIRNAQLLPAMDDEGENEFVVEQVNDVVKNAITKTLGGLLVKRQLLQWYCSSGSVVIVVAVVAAESKHRYSGDASRQSERDSSHIL